MKILHIVFMLCAMLSYIDRTSAAEQIGVARKLVFTKSTDGGYEFDTGILRGKLREAGKGLGMTSAVHLPSGKKLSGAYGILSYYRVFTTNKRYGHPAWEWPSSSKLLSDGAVQVTWPRGNDRPFGMVAVYRFRDASTLDVETTVNAVENLSKFEVFLASYFHENFPLPQVYVTACPETEDNPAFLTAKKSFGNWQMFPRGDEVLPIIRDGRWQKQPNPVDWKIMPTLAKPIALRRGSKETKTAILMAPPGDCFAISTPYEGEGHYSLYFSLFGCDIRAGQTATARLRLVLANYVSDQDVLNLYRKYMKDMSKLAIQKDSL
jgi:hypothetical protein